MLLAYIVFGFLIAGLSAYGLVVFAEVEWKGAGARKAKEIGLGERFTSAHGVKSAPPQPETSPANGGRQDHGTKLKRAGAQFQWGEFTLRELEERLTRDTQALNSEAWKREA